MKLHFLPIADFLKEGLKLIRWSARISSAILMKGHTDN